MEEKPITQNTIDKELYKLIMCDDISHFACYLLMILHCSFCYNFTEALVVNPVFDSGQFDIELLANVIYFVRLQLSQTKNYISFEYFSHWPNAVKKSITHTNTHNFDAFESGLRIRELLVLHIMSCGSDLMR